MEVFIFFENRYEGLSSLLKDDTYTQKVMGEITWFMSLMKHLQSKKNVKVIHCSDTNSFYMNLTKYKIFNPYLIMDFMTIPETINFIDLNKTYCMCYWGRDENSIKQLGNKNGKFISLKNVLTPFDYNNQNSYLGYNLDILCDQINNRKYNEEYGILWGKDIEQINIKLVTQLCKMGIHFYSTSETKLDIDGVINLGIKPKKEWYLLLDNCKFILGSGNPSSGPTILEALYYKTPLFCPSGQVPKSCQGSENIYFINNMNADQIYHKIISVEFKDDKITKSLINSNDYNSRVSKIFNLNPNPNPTSV
jgi:hypothetical protein